MNAHIHVYPLDCTPSAHPYRTLEDRISLCLCLSRHYAYTRIYMMAQVQKFLATPDKAFYFNLPPNTAIDAPPSISSSFSTSASSGNSSSSSSITNGSNEALNSSGGRMGRARGSRLLGVGGVLGTRRRPDAGTGNSTASKHVGASTGATSNRTLLEMQLVPAAFLQFAWSDGESVTGGCLKEEVRAVVSYFCISLSLSALDSSSLVHHVHRLIDL